MPNQKHKEKKEPEQHERRQYRDWPVERLEQVAQMLYTVRPFSPERWNESRLWKELARRAADFLDHVGDACHEVAIGRSVTRAAYDRADARAAELANLPEVVPFGEAIMLITRKSRIDRALPELRKLLLHNRRYFGTVKVDAQIEAWRKSDFSRNEVSELQALFDASWPRIVAKQNSAKPKRRKPRLNVKDAPIIREVLRETGTGANA